MSDQQPPPKPKPGSLRDRIAAFEKSASVTPPAPAGQAAPAPRPKPPGFASWKPKVPSPPSSPSSSSMDNAVSTPSKATGTMSASDAKESITKGGGGSLKDRMAALQGKGAFGAPAPPLAPKPAVEKPRWKPPPTVAAPADNDDDDGVDNTTGDEPPAAAIAATVDRTVLVKSLGSLDDLPEPIAEGEETFTAKPTTSTEGDAEGTTDPEEEERQRRAAIAARMARLGGARMGMAPPVLAKKPVPVRRPTREDISKQEDREETPRRESLSFEGRGKDMEGNISSSFPIADEGATVASPPSFTDTPHVQSQSDIERSPDHLPVRKNSESASLLSVDSTDSNGARSIPSMPVPSVPRRAGLPRKRPVRPTAPPPEVPEVSEERVEEAIASLAIISTVGEPEQKAIKTTEEEVIKAPEHEILVLLDHKEIDDHLDEIHDEPQPIDSGVYPKSAKKLLGESEPGSSGESKGQKFEHDVQSPLATIEALDKLKQEHEHPNKHSQDYDENRGAVHHEHQHLHHVNVDIHAEPQPSSAVGVTGIDEECEDDAEEETRRKRVAERLAKMGGVNPFAAPLISPPLRRSSEETGLASSPVVSGHVSPPSVALPVSPPRPDIPLRKASLRSPHEPHMLPVVGPRIKEQREAEYSDEAEAEDDNDAYAKKGSSDESRIHEKPTKESSLSASYLSPPSPSPPPPPALPAPLRHQQVDTAHVCQLPDPIPRPPVLDSTRPHVQMRQYRQQVEEEEHSTHPVTRHLSPSSRLPDPSVSHEGSLPPARPAQPPRRIVPQAPGEQEQEEVDETKEEAETDDEEHERLVPSHLFLRPVQPRGPVPWYPVSGGRRHEADEDEDEDEDGDGSENDVQALPVLQRRLVEVPPGRSLPPPPPPSVVCPAHLHLQLHLPGPLSDISEPDSDYDGQALPVRPRHITVPPAPPPTSVQLATSRRSVPCVPTNDLSYGMPSVAISEPEPEPGEILDEEEGDPIDPAFHSPSRRASIANARGPAPGDIAVLPVQILTPVLPANVEKREEAQQQQEQDQTRRHTIAERMAKLGGIKFGAAPIPAALSRQVPHEEEKVDEEASSHHHPGHYPQVDAEDVKQSVECSEEEEERARKERIAVKLAGMGGMRIGMMPMGMKSLSPQRAHVLKDENVPPLSPTRAAPSAVRPPPPPMRPQTQDTDSERASDDGVKVEAEESEMEEVNYEDVAEEFEETTPPPPVPSRERIGYRRESTDKTIFSPPPPPPIPGSRPPVPVAHRSSVQTSKSTASVDFGFGPSRAAPSHVFPQSEYVMVDEPHSLEEATPPSHRISRAPPVRPPPIPTAIAQTSDPNSISSQWELPSIPVLDFGNSADLSLSSWTDAGEPTSPDVPSQPPPPPPPSKDTAVLPPTPKPVSPSELQLSTDDLMMIWGRVGVQVCEVATGLFEKSKKTLIGDGSYAGFITTVLAGVPNAAPISIASGEYGYLVYAQNGSSVQKRVSEIMPGDIVEIHEGKLKGHKGIQIYHQNVGGSGEVLLGVVGEFEAKKSKVRVFHANQHVGQQTVESVSYRLEDLKSGTVKVYRVLEG